MEVEILGNKASRLEQMSIKMNLKLKPNEFQLEVGIELLTVRTS